MFHRSGGAAIEPRASRPTKRDTMRSDIDSSTYDIASCYHAVVDVEDEENGEPLQRPRRRRACLRLLLVASIALLLLISSTWRAVVPPLFSPAIPIGSESVSSIRSVDGWLNYTLTVEAAEWHLPKHNIRFQTRLYNSLLPSPILYARPGDRVRLLLRNALGPDVASPMNDALGRGFRQANTTNLHLHGIYDDAVHDDTFARVGPGQEKLYEYSLHPRSGTTLIYYHPHADGSTTMQSVGGMGGVLVIEDSEQESSMGLPPHRTLVLLLQSLQFDPLKVDFVSAQLRNGGSSTMDARLVNEGGCTGSVLLVNGDDSERREAVPAGGWLRLKLVNAVIGSGGSLLLGFDGRNSAAGDGEGGSEGGSDVGDGGDGDAGAACTVAVLAYDGVFLTSPRIQPAVMLPPGGRVEVMVGCSSPGEHSFGTLPPGEFGGTMNGAHTVVVLEVVPTSGMDAAAAAAAMEPLPSTLPGPPSYYRTLLDGEGTEDGKQGREPSAAAAAAVGPADRRLIEFADPQGDNVVNGRPYNLSRPDFTLVRGQTAEWRLVAAEAPGTALKLHPYHQHMTHFQIVAIDWRESDAADATTDSEGGSAAAGRSDSSVVPPTLTPSTFASIGDWRDTIPLYATVSYTIRFVAPFAGLMMVHCHIQKHAENGMMAIALIREPIKQSGGGA